MILYGTIIYISTGMITTLNFYLIFYIPRIVERELPRSLEPETLICCVNR